MGIWEFANIWGNLNDLFSSRRIHVWSRLWVGLKTNKLIWELSWTAVVVVVEWPWWRVEGLAYITSAAARLTTNKLRELHAHILYVVRYLLLCACSGKQTGVTELRTLIPIHTWYIIDIHSWVHDPSRHSDRTKFTRLANSIDSEFTIPY